MIVLLGLTTVLPLALEPEVTLTFPFITKDGSVLAGGERAYVGADAVVAESSVPADCYSSLRVGVAQAEVAKNKYVIIIGRAKIKCYG